MISFFPEPYEDEALYSIIARYHQRSGNTIIRESLSDLFDGKSVHASVVLARNLCAMAEKTEPFGMEFEALLSRTLFPYYTVFAQQETYNKIYNWARNNEAGPVIALLGLFGGGVLQPETLRFCPECLLEELTEYGEGYWHLLHQTPGVLVCEKHFRRLLNSDIPYLSRGGNEHVPAAVDRLLPTDIPKPLGPREQQLACQIALDTKWLLSHIELARNTFVEYGYSFQRLFIHLLREKGLATAHGTLRQDEYRSAFIAFFGDDFLNLFELDFAADIKRPWIISMCRTSITATYPLKYILLARFLCGSFEKFIHFAMTHADAIRPRKPRVPHEVVDEESKRVRYRAEWLKAWRSMPEGGRNDVRIIVPSVYTWLIRHDKMWLYENMPTQRKRGGKRNYADWDERDRLYASQIRCAAERIKQLPGKPVRVSIKKICQQLGCSELLLQKREYLPLTTREFSIVVEDNNNSHII